MMKFKKYCNDNLGWILFIGVFLWIISAYAGTNNLTSVPAGKFKRSHINQYYTALGEDFLPRNSSGTITTRGGSLGDSTRDWLKAHVASGGWEAGDIKMHHSFNGVVTCGQGWMLMDGRQITEANYNAEHAAGNWATYVVSSPVENLYLPDMDEVYPIGQDATTQTGIGAAPTSVGNASHQIDIEHLHTSNSHTHTTTAHGHRWYDYVDSSTVSKSYDSSYSAVNISSQGCSALAIGVDSSTCFYSLSDGGDFYTTGASPSTTGTTDTMNNTLSTTQSVKPESMDLQFCMRIIN
ncbi:MAG: hypothetical protein ACXAC2_02565 [Candidatus Kariarchaeaceae archaeon]|jgi:hypothetical protein